MQRSEPIRIRANLDDTGVYPAGASDVVARIAAKPRATGSVTSRWRTASSRRRHWRAESAGLASGRLLVLQARRGLLVRQSGNWYRSDDSVRGRAVESDFRSSRAHRPSRHGRSRCTGTRQRGSCYQLRQHRDGSFHHLIGNRFSKVIGAQTVHALQGHHAAHAGFDRASEWTLPCRRDVWQSSRRAAGEDSRSSSKERIRRYSRSCRQRRKRSSRISTGSGERLLRQEATRRSWSRKKLHLAISEALHAPSARENLEAQDGAEGAQAVAERGGRKVLNKRVLCSSVRWLAKLR